MGNRAPFPFLIISNKKRRQFKTLDGKEYKAALSNAITYHDDHAELQIVGGSAKSRDEVYLPVTMNAVGDVYGPSTLTATKRG